MKKYNVYMTMPLNGTDTKEELFSSLLTQEDADDFMRGIADFMNDGGGKATWDDQHKKCELRGVNGNWAGTLHLEIEEEQQ